MMKSVLLTFKIFNNKQPTLHEKGMTSYQNIETTCLIITPSIIIIIIEPCKRDQTSILLLVKNANNRPTFQWHEINIIFFHPNATFNTQCGYKIWEQQIWKNELPNVLRVLIYCLIFIKKCNIVCLNIKIHKIQNFTKYPSLNIKIKMGKWSHVSILLASM
jgi:hypothetical protein